MRLLDMDRNITQIHLDRRQLLPGDKRMQGRLGLAATLRRHRMVMPDDEVRCGTPMVLLRPMDLVCIVYTLFVQVVFISYRRRCWPVILETSFL